MSHITLPRGELEKALEALESCGYTPENEMVFNPQKVQDARYALRARLAADHGPRRELSEEEIDACSAEAADMTDDPDEWEYKFARAIERKVK